MKKNKIWWHLMTSDEIWWNLMKSWFHQISSGFIRFHQILFFFIFLFPSPIFFFLHQYFFATHKKCNTNVLKTLLWQKHNQIIPFELHSWCCVHIFLQVGLGKNPLRNTQVNQLNHMWIAYMFEQKPWRNMSIPFQITIWGPCWIENMGSSTEAF